MWTANLKVKKRASMLCNSRKTKRRNIFIAFETPSRSVNRGRCVIRPHTDTGIPVEVQLPSSSDCELIVFLQTL